MQEFLQKKNFFQKILAEKIKEIRLSQNKSISLISAEIGMTKSMWADMEKGIKDPQISTLKRMAEGMDIKLSQLIAYCEDELGQDFLLTE